MIEALSSKIVELTQERDTLKSSHSALVEENASLRTQLEQAEHALGLITQIRIQDKSMTDAFHEAKRTAYGYFDGKTALKDRGTNPLKVPREVKP